MQSECSGNLPGNLCRRLRLIRQSEEPPRPPELFTQSMHTSVRGPLESYVGSSPSDPAGRGRLRRRRSMVSPITGTVTAVRKRRAATCLSTSATPNVITAGWASPPVAPRVVWCRLLHPAFAPVVAEGSTHSRTWRTPTQVASSVVGRARSKTVQHPRHRGLPSTTPAGDRSEVGGPPHGPLHSPERRSADPV
jgi:hypothetical protein